jgi:hypothetical protein
VNLPTLGAALDVVTHESLHMRGLTDEGQTECDAIHALPSFLVARWGFRKGSPAYAQVMYGAICAPDALDGPIPESKKPRLRGFSRGAEIRTRDL